LLRKKLNSKAGAKTVFFLLKNMVFAPAKKKSGGADGQKMENA
jgi:hypothetical protein